MSEAYQAAWRDSQTDPDAFWMAAADAIDWTVRPQQAFDQAEGWFPGASLNTCHNCVDRHVAAGRGEQTALIYDSPVTGAVQHWTYAGLLDEVGEAPVQAIHVGPGGNRGCRRCGRAGGTGRLLDGSKVAHLSHPGVKLKGARGRGVRR